MSRSARVQACRSSVSATPTWPELINPPAGEGSASLHLWPENSSGFSLHAATVVPKGERDRLEKLCRYISRPALCLKRVEVRSDGNIVWSLRRVWRDGTKSFVFTPQEFIAKLAGLVPHPREHQLTYQGVLAPASPLRDQVVPRPVITDPETVAKFLASVRRKAKSQASAGSGGGGDGCSQAQGRAPPTGRGERIPKPPRQGRLDFAK